MAGRARAMSAIRAREVRRCARCFDCMWLIRWLLCQTGRRGGRGVKRLARIGIGGPVLGMPPALSRHWMPGMPGRLEGNGWEGGGLVGPAVQGAAPVAGDRHG